MRLKTLAIMLLCCVQWMCAQELKCTVTVNSDKIEGSSKSMFEALQQSLTELMNNTRWTNMVFAEQERIECTLMLIVNSVSPEGLMDATMQLQSRRPVYNTNYSTPLLNISDNSFAFTYKEFDRVEIQATQFTSNLAALIAYYSYLIIGFDMDSYSRLGGTPCFQKCEEICNMAQGASIEQAEAAGWKAFGNNKNRFALINNLLDEAFKDFRGYFYEYHRLGLDEMAANAGNGRARIAGGIEVLKSAYKARPGTYITGVFLDAKNDELVQLFKQGTDAEKKTVVGVLTEVDPTRSEQYEKISE